jgi:hypothetical protein
MEQRQQQLANSIIINTPGVYDYKNISQIWSGSQTSALFIFSNDVSVRNFNLTTPDTYTAIPITIGNANTQYKNITLDGITLKSSGQVLVDIINCTVVRIKNSNLGGSQNTSDVVRITNSTFVSIENNTLSQGHTSINTSGNCTGLIKGNKMVNSNYGIDYSKCHSNSKWCVDNNTFHMVQSACKYGKGKIKMCTQNNTFPSSSGNLKNGLKDFNPMDLQIPSMGPMGTNMNGMMVNTRAPTGSVPVPTTKSFNWKTWLIYGGIALIIILIIILVIVLIVKLAKKPRA